SPALELVAQPVVALAELGRGVAACAPGLGHALFEPADLVLQGGERGEGAPRLVRHAALEPGVDLLAQQRDARLTRRVDAAFVGSLVASRDAEQRGVAGPFRADQPDAVARADSELDAGEEPPAAEPLSDALEPQQHGPEGRRGSGAFKRRPRPADTERWTRTSSSSPARRASTCSSTPAPSRRPSRRTRRTSRPWCAPTPGAWSGRSTGCWPSPPARPGASSSSRSRASSSTCSCCSTSSCSTVGCAATAPYTERAILRPGSPSPGAPARARAASTSSARCARRGTRTRSPPLVRNKRCPWRSACENRSRSSSTSARQ